MQHTWRSLNSALRTLDEGKVLEMLAHERRNDKRAAVLQRLHQR